MPDTIGLQNLFEAARNVLYSSLPIGRDTLEIGATAVGYSPVAVLAPPLRVLLYIWDALLTVQVSSVTISLITKKAQFSFLSPLVYLRITKDGAYH